MSNGMGLLGDFAPGADALSGGPAFSVAIAVIVSMLVLVGIAYLIAQVFRLRRLEDWAKSEFLQVFVSAAIVGGLYVLMAPGTGVINIAFSSLVPAMPDIPTMSGGPFDSSGLCGLVNLSPGTPICYAYRYMGGLSSLIGGLITALFQINLILDILSKISIDVIVVEVSPLSGLSSFVQVFQNILQSLLFLNIIVEVERALLVFADKAALQFFLPIGVVLRTFFGTRRLGGALIALAIGAYLIFPLTICLNAAAVNQSSLGNTTTIVNLLDNAERLNPLKTFAGPGDIVSPAKWSGFLDSYVTIGSSINSAAAAVPGILNTIVAILIVEIVFLPILSIMLTAIAIKELAALFGSEINLSRFEV